MTADQLDHVTMETDAETLACDEGREQEFVHYRDLPEEQPIYDVGGWISGHCGDPRCAL